MFVRVILHGWLKQRQGGAGEHLELEIPDGSDIASLVDLLRETSHLPAQRAVIAVVDHVRVGKDCLIQNGESVHIYTATSGG